MHRRMLPFAVSLASGRPEWRRENVFFIDPYTVFNLGGGVDRARYLLDNGNYFSLLQNELPATLHASLVF